MTFSAGLADNELQYYDRDFFKLATNRGFTMDVGFQYRASKKVHLAFNFSRTSITVDKSDSQFKDISFQKTNPMNVNLILAGFKAFIGEEVTLYLMPQFGFVIMNYGKLEALDQQQKSVFLMSGSSHIRLALAVAIGSDVQLGKRLVLSMKGQYLTSSKVVGNPIYQSLNASIGVGYRF